MTTIKDILKEVSESEERYIKISMDIANQISAYMKEKDWFQADLARELKKNESEISKWLSGTHNFTVKTLALIESVFHKDLFIIPLDMETRKINFEKTAKQITNTRFYTQEEVLQLLHNLGGPITIGQEVYGNQKTGELSISSILTTINEKQFLLQRMS